MHAIANISLLICSSTASRSLYSIHTQQGNSLLQIISVEIKNSGASSPQCKSYSLIPIAIKINLGFYASVLYLDKGGFSVGSL